MMLLYLITYYLPVVSNIWTAGWTSYLLAILVARTLSLMFISASWIASQVGYFEFSHYRTISRHFLPVDLCDASVESSTSSLTSSCTPSSNQFSGKNSEKKIYFTNSHDTCFQAFSNCKINPPVGKCTVNIIESSMIVWIFVHFLVISYKELFRTLYHSNYGELV